MKSFNIPLVDKDFYIYIGEKEWEKFKNDSIDNGADESREEKYPGKDSGRAGGSWIWVDSKKDTNTMIHELTHFVDDLLVYLNTDDREFKAYLTAWIIDNVLRWAK